MKMNQILIFILGFFLYTRFKNSSDINDIEVEYKEVNDTDYGILNTFKTISNSILDTIVSPIVNPIVQQQTQTFSNTPYKDYVSTSIDELSKNVSKTSYSDLSNSSKITSNIAVKSGSLINSTKTIGVEKIDTVYMKPPVQQSEQEIKSHECTTCNSDIQHDQDQIDLSREQSTTVSGDLRSQLRDQARIRNFEKYSQDV